MMTSRDRCEELAGQRETYAGCADDTSRVDTRGSFGKEKGRRCAPPFE
jgi:hypothetical protein